MSGLTGKPQHNPRDRQRARRIQRDGEGCFELT